LYEEVISCQSSLLFKNVGILNFELLPNIQNNLNWHENFTTVIRLQGEHNPTNFYWKLTFDEKDTNPQSCNHLNTFWWIQIVLMNFEWLPKNQYNFNWSKSFITQIKKSINLTTSFIEFENRMQKLHHFELDLKVHEDNVGSLGHLGLKFHKRPILQP